MTSPLTYRESGVDIDAGDALVAAIGGAVRSTRRLGTMGGIGGFGGVFDLAKAGYRDPLLVSATDGVGTKLKIAFETGNHRTVGIDLVAMCVNDLIVQGAEPLFFLDYFATSRLDVARAAEVIEGIADGCRLAGCALIGGETAELPAFYDGDEYDLAGFAVGAVERDRLLPRDDVAIGDLVLALPSSGLHSNGFSLVRKILEKSGLKLSDNAPFEHGISLGDALLTPTSVYAGHLNTALKSHLPVKALCHITGGGLIDNLPRILPEGLGAAIDLAGHPRPAVFDWLAANGPVARHEMARTFNCGVGMVAIVSPSQRQRVEDGLAAADLAARQIGTITKPPDGTPVITVAGGPGI